MRAGSENRVVEIIDFPEGNREAIKLLNVEWLEKYFRVEPIDIIQLNDPVGEIIAKGGMIYYARCNDQIVGTVSLMKVEDGVYELAKMAVTESAQGLGIGHKLMDHCMLIASQKAMKKLILLSNRKLHSAIHLYKQYGFAEVPLDHIPYERANIKMEKVL